MRGTGKNRQKEMSSSAAPHSTCRAQVCRVSLEDHYNHSLSRQDAASGGYSGGGAMGERTAPQAWLHTLLQLEVSSGLPPSPLDPPVTMSPLSLLIRALSISLGFLWLLHLISRVFITSPKTLSTCSHICSYHGDRK